MTPGRGRSVVILAGGASRRLGRDKPWVEIGGTTVLGRLLEAAREAGVADVVVAARDRRRFSDRLREAEPGRASPAVRVTEDEAPDLGPVAGFAAGLAEARGPVAVVLGADLPFATGRLVSALFRAIEDDPAADAVVPNVGGRDQPLCAAYRREPALAAARGLLEARAGAGPSVAALLDRLTVRRPVSLGDVDEGALAVQSRGIDTPEDLEWARARVGREEA